MDPQATPEPPGPGETAGSPQRPARQLVGPVLSFDLAQEIATLQQEASWQRGDRNARTLVEEPSLRIVLTVLKTGAHIREHRTDHPVVIQTLQGYIRLMRRSTCSPAGSWRWSRACPTMWRQSSRAPSS